MTDFVVLVYLYIYLPDDDLVEVKTCRWGESDNDYFFMDLQFVGLNPV